ncbi:MAG: serine/threonine protein kinase, partial [Paracoccaceae bacterium]
PNIVGVHQVFEENSTAYMALDFIDGMDMLSVIDEAPQRLTPELIRSALMKSLGAISYIHNKGILHRDISPDNFLLDGADNLTLIDFGAAREHATKAHRELSTLLAVKDGYSPQEFYQPGVTQCAASDLYSLGATFYHIITGYAPPHSQQRLAAIAADKKDPYRPLVTITQDFDRDFLAAIDKALEVFPEKRLQSAQEWGEAIDAERRRQAAEARAKLDTTIQLKISKLVADTNSSLHAPIPGDTAKPDHQPEQVVVQRRMVRPPSAPQQDIREKTPPVDMFGTPIDDVEAWLRAQDRLAPRRKKPKPDPASKGKSSAKSKKKSGPGEPSQRGPNRSRFFRALVGRLSPSGPTKPKKP